jgi:PIN domain nuclease of toxin-antitoxin system
MGNDDPLSDDAVEVLDGASDRDEQVAISPISAWEIGILAAKGRFASPLPPSSWFSRFVSGGRYTLPPLSPDILIESSFLPGNPPNDPIDRIIIATAREHGLTVLTRDRTIIQYGKAGHISVIEC